MLPSIMGFLPGIKNCSCRRSAGPVFLHQFSFGFPMVFLWFSYTFSSGPVAWVAPPVAAGRGCPAVHGPLFLWFSYTFSSGPVAVIPPLVAAARGC